MGKDQNRSTVSVIIPAYNSHLTLGKSIDGLLGQSAYDKIDEIIIVDSSDKKEALDQLEALRKEERVTVLTSGVRVMPAIQRNMGAKHAKSEILCFLDSDAFPSVQWVEKIIEVVASGYKVGGGSYKLPDFQVNMIIPRAQYYLEFNEFIDVGKPRPKRLVPSCNLFCQRELFLQVGGFPEIRASEDTMFGLIMNQTTPMMFFPDLIIYHIFREQKDHYYKNQILLGQYIFIYRKYIYNSVYYRGILPYLFLPGFVLVKFMRISLRLAFSGKTHIRKSLPTMFQFMKGLFFWSRGFWIGIGKYKDLESLFALNGSFTQNSIATNKKLVQMHSKKSKHQG